MAVLYIRDSKGNAIPIRSIKGKDGLDGKDGKQMFVRFSQYEDGTDMSEEWIANRNYLGIAFGIEAPADKADYQWVRVSHLPNGMTMDSDNNLHVSGEVTFGEDHFSPREALLNVIPCWSVDENIGAISPAESIEYKQYALSDTVDASMSIPMINSGDLYLDFSYTIDIYTIEGSYYWDVFFDVYVNKGLVKTFTSTSLEVAGNYRAALTVNRGDVVTFVPRVTPHSSLSAHHQVDYCSMKVTDIQLKANITTMHTYSTLKGLENPTLPESFDN